MYHWVINIHSDKSCGIAFNMSDATWVDLQLSLEESVQLLQSMCLEFRAEVLNAYPNAAFRGFPPEGPTQLAMGKDNVERCDYRDES